MAYKIKVIDSLNSLRDKDCCCGTRTTLLVAYCPNYTILVTKISVNSNETLFKQHINCTYIYYNIADVLLAAL